MNNLHRIVPQDLINEIIWLQEQSMRARAKGHHRAADTWQANAHTLLREIGGLEA